MMVPPFNTNSTLSTVSYITPFRALTQYAFLCFFVIINRFNINIPSPIIGNKAHQAAKINQGDIGPKKGVVGRNGY